MTDKFTEWVKRHQIGPGMNDRYFATSRGESPPKLYSGFDGRVGDGWIPILERLATDLIAMGWDRDLHQVKEKFGGLRFYVGESTDEMRERIHQAERESFGICETCGQPGEAKGPGWIVTLCDPCRVEYKKARGIR